MGYRYVKGLGSRERAQLEAAPPPYASLEDFVRRTGLHEKHLVSLAEAGAFDSFDLARRDALWSLRGLVASRDDSLRLPEAPNQPEFEAISQAETVTWDYEKTAHSTRGHPMEALRETLVARGHPDSSAVRSAKAGARIDYVGLVICRQRPETASGVTFYTLEDEVGFVNVVVFRPVFDRHVVLARTASLLGVSGRIQREAGVTHLVAENLFSPSLAPSAVPRSRDFH